jgi:NADH-quinone oxidoreductase subunit L
LILALGGEQDLRRMGGLRSMIKWTFLTFAVGTAAIAGIPPFAGFFSKDMILAGALAGHHHILFAVAYFTALLTAFYMARLLALAFLGTYRPTEPGASAHDDGHGNGQGHGGVHESPLVMLLPLAILAFASLVGGFVDLPHFITPVFRQAAGHEAHAAWLPWAAGGGALLASLAGLYLYTGAEGTREGLARALRPLARLAGRQYWFDAAYGWFARRVVVQGSQGLLRGVDNALIDGAVNGTGTLVDAVSRGVRGWQTGLVRGYALLILGGAVSLLGYLLWRR